MLPGVPLFSFSLCSQTLSSSHSHRCPMVMLQLVLNPEKLPAFVIKNPKQHETLWIQIMSLNAPLRQWQFVQVQVPVFIHTSRSWSHFPHTSWIGFDTPSSSALVETGAGSLSRMFPVQIDKERKFISRNIR